MAEVAYYTKEGLENLKKEFLPQLNFTLGTCSYRLKKNFLIC